MKTLDKDLIARYKALAPWIQQAAVAHGYDGREDTVKAYGDKRELLNTRLQWLAAAYGYGDNTTQFLRDVVHDRLFEFSVYERAYREQEKTARNRKGQYAYKYRQGEGGMTLENLFYETQIRGNRNVIDRWQAKRNVDAWHMRKSKRRRRENGVSDYKVSGGFRHGNGKHTALDEVAAGKLSAKPRIKKNRLRKPTSKRRSHRANA